MSRVIRLAVIPGDGIGPEVIAEALKVLDAAVAVASVTDAVTIEKTHFSLGAARYLETGDVLTDHDLAAIASHDAILLGAVGGVPGDPRLKDANIERGLLLKLRFSLDHFVNLRPTTIYPGVTSPLSNPGAVDFVVVREGTEGPYVGNGGAIRVGTPHEIASEVSVNTAYGVERVVRFAFALADSRPRKKLTLVHKTNVLVFSGSLWQSTVTAVAAEYPDVTVDYLHVDAATIFFVTDPARFDTIVTDNLFGDILTDLAGAISGGIGLASSGNINPTGDFPSMFEPVHGSAPDIAGRQLADPTAAILSVALLLDQQGLPEAATAIRTAVTGDLANRTADSPGRSTAEIGDAIVTATAAALDSSPHTSRLLSPRTTRTDDDHNDNTHHVSLAFSATPSTAARADAEREAILADPGFGKHFTDHMVSIEWTLDGGWHDASVVPYGPLSLDPAASVLHYAQEIFEGMKAYRHADGGIYTFRPDQNAARLQRSAQRLALPELSTEDFIESLRQLIALDGAWVPDAPETSLYIRPFMFATESFLGVRSAQKVGYYVIASPAGAYFSGESRP